MEDFAALERILKTKLLSHKNAERLIRVFYDAAKIVSRRESRLKKPQLKLKEISSAVVLAESLHSNMYHFDAVGVLAECFGGCDEATAIKYFEDKVMGDLKDKAGRKVVIDEDAMNSLYKEQTTGRHVVSAENYEEVRGKRLPWIRHTIANSTSVYVHEEAAMTGIRRSYLYVATVSVPLRKQKPQTSYYVVVVRETKGGLKTITAYSMVPRNKFLKVIEPCFPLR
jgi:hypothetical protein